MAEFFHWVAVICFAILGLLAVGSFFVGLEDGRRIQEEARLAQEKARTRVDIHVHHHPSEKPKSD